MSSIPTTRIPLGCPATLRAARARGPPRALAAAAGRPTAHLHLHLRSDPVPHHCEGIPVIDDLLNAAKRHLGSTGFAIGDDLRALETRLGPGERIEHHVRGRDDDDRLLWAATPHRLLLVEREGFEREVDEVGWSDVRHLESRPGTWGTTLVLITARKRYRIEGVVPAEAEAFGSLVRDRMKLAVSGTTAGTDHSDRR